MESHKVYQDILSRSNGHRFRLITLHPSESKEAVISCDLTIRPLSEHQEYEALSYCWGDASDTRPVQCNGTTLNVTSNLQAALVQLRRADTPRILWVDAVCIDQSNLAERACQVSYMRTIYRNAVRVVVWLGPQEEKSELVFPLCQRIAKSWYLLANGNGDVAWQESVMNEVTEAWVQSSLISRHPNLKEQSGMGGEQFDHAAFEELFNKPKELRSGGLLTFDVMREDGKQATAALAHIQFDEFLAFMKLIRRPWWTRTWVVQEISLAKEALVVCGDKDINWDVFATAILILNWEQNNPMDSLLSYDYALSLLKLIAKLRLTTTPMDLLDMLWQFRSLRATDPRDKVHAFLGLMPENDPVHHQIRPNYEIDIAQCYIQAARASILLRQNLDFLATERYPSSRLGSSLPSWVPDWDFTDPHVSPLPLQVPQVESDSLQPFAASGSCSTTFVPSSDGECPELLVLSGLVVDDVEELEIALPAPNEVYGSYFDGTEDEFGFKIARKIAASFGAYYEGMIRWEKFATRARSSSAEKEHLLRELSVTLCAGHMPRGPDEMYESFCKWRADLKWPKRLAKLDGALGRKCIPRGLYHALMGFSGQIHKPADIPKDEDVFITRIQVAGSRQLARTGRGCLALVPKHAQHGDRVVVCRGSKLPLILRPSSNEQGWEFVGCAYVHGIMYGEAWTEDECRDIRLS